LIGQAILLLVCGFIIHPHGGCSSRRALIETDNPCMHARVIVNSIEVMSRLEAIFVYLVPYG
jgi:hypothetical protein